MASARRPQFKFLPWCGNLSHNFHYCSWTDLGRNFSALVQLLVAWTFMYFPQGCTRWQSASYWPISIRGSVITTVATTVVIIVPHLWVLTCPCEGLRYHYSSDSWCTSHNWAETIILNIITPICIALYICVSEIFNAPRRPGCIVLIKTEDANLSYIRISYAGK
jgi:hypothetical protein